MARAALDALRAKIRELEGGPRVVRRRVPTGAKAVDDLIGGLPQPGIVEVVGSEGSGRARWVAACVSSLTQRHETVAWVDPGHRAYPPGLAAHGVEPSKLLLVRPAEDGSSPWAWATEQLLRSGCFSVVVLDLPARTGSRRSLAHSWARAAEYGSTTAVVMATRPTRELPAEVRLSVGAGRVFVVRDRAGRPGREGSLPAWPVGADPWL